MKAEAADVNIGQFGDITSDDHRYIHASIFEDINSMMMVDSNHVVSIYLQGQPLINYSH